MKNHFFVFGLFSLLALSLMIGFEPVNGYSNATKTNRYKKVVVTPEKNLYSASIIYSNPFSFDFMMDLSYGMSNYEVKVLQNRLRLEGYFDFLFSTGYFGPTTYAAVSAYQKAHNLPETGYVGELTRNELNSRY
jgi:hypothetical protein